MFNEKSSGIYDLPGGGPQCTLIGGIEYAVQSNDNADFLEEDNKFKWLCAQHHLTKKKNKIIAVLLCIVI